MPKRIFVIVLAFFAFACTGCHHDEGPKECPGLPSLHITMTSLQVDSIIEDRDIKVSAYAILYNTDGDTLFQGNLTHVKTRGNSTHDEKKKPLAIKFPKKQSFFGLDRSKSFVLLANACDESHIRNAIALDLARAMGIPAPRYAYLTLYINDSYCGLYQITNKVQVGKDALDITDLDKRNEWVNSKPLDEYEWFGRGRKNQMVLRKGIMLENDPDDITGGYLIENSGPRSPYQRTLSGFVSNAEDLIRIRSPKYASPREVEYMASMYNEMESAILAPDGINPETGRHYSEYLDLESFARYYLLNELLFNYDGGWSSFMMFKNSDAVDSKLYAGPAWDYDRTLDNPRFQNNSLIYPNELVACERKDGFVGGLLYQLWHHEDFRKVVSDCYINEISTVCHHYLEEHPYDSLATLLSCEADWDNAMYGGRYSADYTSAVKRATGFLRERVAFFDRYFSSLEEGHVVVSYDWKYQRGYTFIYELGEPVHAPQATKVVYNHDPNYALFYPGTDSIVPDGSVFHTPQQLELRKVEPSEHEVLIRRIKKKLRKIGLDF